MSRVLALDLGGTRLRAALAPLDDPTALDPVGRWPAPDSAGALRGRVLEIAAAAGPLAGIGVTVPGLVEGTVCRWVPNLPHLDGVDLALLLAPAGAPVAAGNDAQLALLAEAAAGAARDVSDALLLAIGTGIGSAVLAGGGIVTGARGHACSFGWACADQADAGHDRRGWLERHAAGPALDAAAAALGGGADGAALIAAARAGDGASLAAVERAARALGTALAGAVALLDPAVLLIAGGVSEALDVLAPPLRAQLRRHLPPHLRDVPLRRAAFGDEAGLVGAAVAAARGPGWARRR